MPGGGLADRNSGTAGSGTLQRLQLHFNFTSTSSSLLFVTIYKFSSNCSSNWWWGAGWPNFGCSTVTR